MVITLNYYKSKFYLFIYYEFVSFFLVCFVCSLPLVTCYSQFHEFSSHSRTFLYYLFVKLTALFSDSMCSTVSHVLCL